MNEYNSSSKLIRQKKEQKKLWTEGVDFLLRQVLSLNFVNQFWRFYYSRLRKILTISSGAAVLALCMQNKVAAQLFEEVETGALDDFLPEGIEVDFFGEFLSLLLLAGGVAGIIGVAFQISRGGNAEIWVGILVGLISALIAILVWTGAIYGG